MPESNVYFTEAEIARWLAIEVEAVARLTAHLPPRKADGWPFDVDLVKALTLLQTVKATDGPPA